MLPDIFREYFGMPQSTTLEEFLNDPNIQHDERLDGLLVSEESRASALESLKIPVNCHVACCLAPVENWRHATVHFDESTTDVWLLGNLEDVCEVPTDLESLILRILIFSQDKCRDDLFLDKTRINWRKALTNHAIIASPNFQSDESNKLQRLVAAIFQIEHPDLPRTVVSNSLIELTSSITLKSLEILGSLSKAKLLSEAVAEQQPKWRFLSFYRIVENAYLANVKKRFIQAFDIDAKNAIKEAEKSLQSEMNQLVALAEENNLAQVFIPFNVQFEQLLSANNRFINSIERGALEEPLYKVQPIFKKAIVRFYKLRCSIAHGGTSSTIFEEHKDGNDALISLMFDVEAIALKSLELDWN